MNTSILRWVVVGTALYVSAIAIAAVTFYWAGDWSCVSSAACFSYAQRSLSVSSANLALESGIYRNGHADVIHIYTSVVALIVPGLMVSSVGFLYVTARAVGKANTRQIVILLAGTLILASPAGMSVTEPITALFYTEAYEAMSWSRLIGYLAVQYVAMASVLGMAVVMFKISRR